MSERTGVGLVECAVLAAIDSPGARADRGWTKNSRVLALVEERIGLAPGYAYQVLLDLARPWTMPLGLITGQGNFGTRSDPAANPPYTESRLSAAGQAVLAAERGDIAPVPVGLVNGTVYGKGTRPPFRPQAVIDALRLIIARPAVTSQELIDCVGPPCFMNDCLVTGDFPALAAGRPIVLRLESRISVSDDCGTVTITNLPPNVNPDETVRSLASRVRQRDWATGYPGLHQRVHLPLRDIRDESSGRTGERIVCFPERGTAPEQLRDQLREVYGVYSTVPVALPRSLPAWLRSWVDAHAADDLPSGLAVLEDAVRGQPFRG